jgi:hypothetical protein
MVQLSPPYVQSTRWRIWLRYCATSRKVAGSIHWNFLFAMTLDSPLSLTEMSTRVISWGGKGGQCLRLTNLSPSCAYFLEILSASSSSPKGLSRPVYRYTLHLLYPPEPPESVYICWGMQLRILLHICLHGMYGDVFVLHIAVRSDRKYTVASARAWNSEIFCRILMCRWKSSCET